MADTVQYLMEQMIPELEDMERKGYFTRAEIKKIVQKRQNFEYLLKRRAALKEDFYRYIEFEAKLEELRKYRKQQQGLKTKGDKKAKKKQSLADVAIVRRIHFIYERAGRKFRGDLSLWLRWIEACKRYKSAKQLSKVVTKALQRHSAVPELWIEAAKWEFDENGDVAAARALMQQGIRMCRKEEAIWVAYYQMELLYALKLRVRRRVLGLDDLAAQAAAGDEQVDEAASRSAAAVRAVMSGGVAKIVFKNAVAALPERLGFRARFLELLRGFEYGFVAALLDQVYDSVRQDFGKDEEAWDLLARRHVDFPAPGASSGGAGTDQQQPQRTEAEAVEAEAEAAQRQLDAAAAGQRDGQAPEAGEVAGTSDSHRLTCEVYEQALGAVPTARMYDKYGGYLCGTLERLMAAAAGDGEGGAEEGAQEAALKAAVEVAAQLFGVLQRAHAAGLSTPQTYLTWAEWAERVRQPKMALKAARRGCERFPADVALWRQRLTLEQAHAGAGAGGSQLLEVFTQALAATQPEQAVEVWGMAVEAVPASSPEFRRLGELLAGACARVARGAPSGGLGQVAAALVDKARSALGVEAARQLYGQLLSVPGPGGDLYRCAIRIEQDALESSSASGSGSGSGSAAASKQALQAGRKRVTELYEAAVKAHGSSEVDLWVSYAQWLLACGKGPGQVYWRATKELADPDVFVAAYRAALGEAAPQ
ncbi:hypothetical protein HYH03_000955 [Edaphochlamys debaryana]|uniref:U3 small nucleolar RNA-associated protein 6 n=1 Tax=Edaphochlamys debaryana TaxID=47281 RepID=A0A835YEC0_9CHLO|nr:hypothetical protein HYH03_000955 [Edaphochlamys debaryana]|eukprot:KAG2501138.1 hypothetical protein HYH03_000955 [Edaphochlamys debaryana]